MAAPTVVSVSPLPQATGIVLGTQITVQFDQAMDPASVNDSTFTLIGPGMVQILTPEQMSSADPALIGQSEHILGVMSWSDDGTTLSFNPSQPLDQNKPYRVLVLGADGVVSSDGVKSLAGEAMQQTYIWDFSSGDLAVVTPPPASPLPDQTPRIDPKSIVVLPRAVVGNDLSQIDIIFPSDIDTNSFSLNDLLLSIEPMLGDVDVVIPPGLSASAVVEGRRIRITIAGWTNS